jgi:hypothetical protein
MPPFPPSACHRVGRGTRRRASSSRSWSPSSDPPSPSSTVRSLPLPFSTIHPHPVSVATDSRLFKTQRAMDHASLTCLGFFPSSFSLLPSCAGLAVSYIHQGKYDEAEKALMDAIKSVRALDCPSFCLCLVWPNRTRLASLVCGLINQRPDVLSMLGLINRCLSFCLMCLELVGPGHAHQPHRRVAAPAQGARGRRQIPRTGPNIYI